MASSSMEEVQRRIKEDDRTQAATFTASGLLRFLGEKPVYLELAEDDVEQNIVNTRNVSRASKGFSATYQSGMYCADLKNHGVKNYEEDQSRVSYWRRDITSIKTWSRSEQDFDLCWPNASGSETAEEFCNNLQNRDRALVGAEITVAPLEFSDVQMKELKQNFPKKIFG